MDHADFIHLVRLSEHDGAQDARAYRRSVAAFATLGYLWVIGCVALACGVLWWLATSLHQGARMRGFSFWVLAFAVGLLWSSLRALWLRLEPPQGQVVSAADAPALFQALEKIRVKVEGPRIHHVVLNDEFNASITQLPRYGVFGGAVNYLCLGLPLTLALDRRRLLAVLAHEYGHLRGNHGVLGAWIYRTRATWLKLYHALRNDNGVAAWLTQGFFFWYFPRFAAKAFALARQDEYEADKVAARLTGAQAMAAALIEIQVKSAWLDQVFWPEHWHRAVDQPAPMGPFAGMAKLLVLAPQAEFAESAFQQALRRLSDVDDTHPVLRDRLEALEQRAQLPAWSNTSALALLGPKAAQWLAHFDRQWCSENASEWRLHHAYLARVRERMQSLQASLMRNNADECVELASLQFRLDPKCKVRTHYERALALSPAHGAALRGLVSSLDACEQTQRLRCLQTLFDSSAANRWWACRTAVQVLENQARLEHDLPEALKVWRERLKQANEAERRAWEEHRETDFFVGIARDDLSDYEKGEFRADLGRIKAVQRAWLVCKNLREFPQRRCYTVFVELPGLDDEDRYDLCRQLERSLNLPGPVLALWAGQSPTLQQIEANAFQPAYVRTAR
ncbi:MAG: M48 family metallopeptidase [Betaproteobacteria bacterium]